MLTRSQMYNLCLFNKRKPGRALNFFSRLPKELIPLISSYYPGPFSEIGKLLLCIVNADLDTVKIILDDNPKLLLECSSVRLSNGSLVHRVTPYECILGAGDDPEMTKYIASVFLKINAGIKERDRQFKPYQMLIQNMLIQTPYDFTYIFDVIKRSSSNDITKALEKDFTCNNELSKALVTLRESFYPKIIKRGMHFNFNTLIHLLEIYTQEHDNLISGTDDRKRDVVCRYVIGLVQRDMPGRTRQVHTYGLREHVYLLSLDDYHLRAGAAPRSFKFPYGGNLRFGYSHFIPKPNDHVSHTGFGYDVYASDMRGFAANEAYGGLARGWSWLNTASLIRTLCEANIAGMIDDHQSVSSLRCVIS